MSSSVPLLSADLARLVLGYLRLLGCSDAAAAFQREEPTGALAEVRAIEQRGRNVNLQFRGNTLQQFVVEKDDLDAAIDEAFASTGQPTQSAGQEMGSLQKLQLLLQQLKHQDGGQQQTDLVPPSPAESSSALLAVPGPSRMVSPKAQTARVRKTLGCGQQRARVQLATAVSKQQQQQSSSTTAMEERIAQELGSLRPRPQAKSSAASDAPVLLPPLPKLNMSELERTYINLKTMETSTKSAPVRAPPAEISCSGSSNSPQNQPQLLSPGTTGLTKVPQITSREESGYIPSPSKSRKSRMPTKKASSGQQPPPNLNKKPGEVKKALGHLSEAIPDDVISHSIAEPLAEFIDSAADSSNMSIDNTVNNIMNNPTFMDNLLNILEDVEKYESGTSNSQTLPDTSAAAKTSKDRMLATPVHAMDDHIEVNSPKVQNERPAEAAEVQVDFVTSQVESSKKPSHVRNLTLETQTDPANEEQEASDTQPASQSEALPTEPASSAAQNEALETETDSNKAIENPEKHAISPEPSNLPATKEIAHPSSEEGPSKSIQPAANADKSLPAQEIRSLKRQRPPADFSHIVKARDSLKDTESDSKRKQSLPITALNRPVTRSVQRQSFAQTVKTVSKRLAHIMNDFASEHDYSLSYHPNVVAARSGGTLATLQALAQVEQAPAINDMHYVCIRSDTGEAIPFTDIHFVDGNLPGIENFASITQTSQSSQIIVNNQNMDGLVLLGESSAVVEISIPELRSAPKVCDVSQGDDNNTQQQPDNVLDNRKSPAKASSPSPSKHTSPEKRVSGLFTTAKQRTPIRTPLKSVQKSIADSLDTPATSFLESESETPQKNELSPKRPTKIASGAGSSPLKYASPARHVLGGIQGSLFTPMKLGTPLKTPLKDLQNSPADSLDTPIIKCAERDNSTFETPRPKQKASSPTRSEKVHTPGLRLLQEEMDRITSDLSASDDSMSPSRFQRHRSNVLREKVLRKHHPASSKKVGLEIEDCLNKSFISPKKRALQEDHSEGYLSGISMLKSPFQSHNWLQESPAKRSRTVPNILRHSRKKEQVESPLSSVLSEPYTPSKDDFMDSFSLLDSVRNPQRFTPVKSSPPPPRRAMFTSPVKDLTGSYIVSSPKATQGSARSSENRSSPQHGVKKTPVKLLLVGTVPKKQGRRVQLTPVERTSPLRQRDLSLWESRHNVNNLDNYTSHKCANKVAPKTPGKLLQEREEMRAKKRQARHILKGKLDSSIPVPNGKDIVEPLPEGIMPPMGSLSELNVNLELVPQMTKLRQHQNDSRVASPPTSPSPEKDLMGALGLLSTTTPKERPRSSGYLLGSITMSSSSKSKVTIYKKKSFYFESLQRQKSREDSTK